MRGRGGVARKCLALQVASKMSKCEQEKRSKKSKILKDAYSYLNQLVVCLSPNHKMKKVSPTSGGPLSLSRPAPAGRGVVSAQLK